MRGERNASQLGGTPPISALTYALSIGSNRKCRAAGFGLESSTRSAVTRIDDWSSRTGTVKSPASREHRPQRERTASERRAHAHEPAPNAGGTQANSERQLGAPRANGNRQVKLDPLQPPGRATRKARDFEAEILRLRAQGYTLTAIRQALAVAGVHVSISTVRREATRRAAPNPVTAAGTGADCLRTLPSRATATAAADVAPPPDLPSGKDLAEAFARSKSTNPLIRAKEHQ